MHVADGAQRGAVPVLDVRPHVTMQVLGLVVDGSPVDVVDRRLDGLGCRGAGRPGSASAYADRGRSHLPGRVRVHPAVAAAGHQSVSSSTCGSAPSRPLHPALSQVGGGYDEAAPSTASYLLPYAVMSLIERHRALV